MKRKKRGRVKHERGASGSRVCGLLDKTGGRGKKGRRNEGVHVDSLETENNGGIT